MAASSGLYTISALCCFLVALIFFASPTAAVASEQELMGWLPARSGCRGTVAECLDEEEEFGVDSEFSRRILAQTKYVSYGALQRNSVPCSKRGASYYNCKSGGQANPYKRGCSAITRCRS